jgi:hypothetical protein
MILLEIDAERISGSELESDAPRSVDMDRVTGRDEPPQRVEIKPGKVHLFRRPDDIQPVETKQDAFVQADIDPGRAAFRS